MMARKRVSPIVAATIYEEAGGVCALCGQYVEPAQQSIDHIVAVSEGGADDRANLQLAHRRCNLLKGPHRPQLPDRGYVRLDVRVTPSARQLAVRASQTEGVSITEWVTEAIVEKLAREGLGYVPELPATPDQEQP